MPEFPFNSPETRLAMLHDEQNAVEAALRERFLRTHLFQLHVIERAESGAQDIDEDQLFSLWREFMEEKAGMNMGERLAMAIGPKYFDKIHVVELGVTEKPGDDGEIDGLKHEYRDLKRWLQQHGLIEDELPREQSGRTIELRHSEIAPDRVVLIRNRPLVDAQIEAAHGCARFGIAKRMVFSMPVQLLEQLRKMAGTADMQGENLMGVIEKAVQLRNPHIDAIRTGYYLVTQKI